MEKIIFVLLSLIILASSVNTIANDKLIRASTSWALVELSASIDADRLIAERMITLDIEDELSNQDIFKDINDELFTSSREYHNRLLNLETARYSHR